jgi:hypothetical protein
MSQHSSRVTSREMLQAWSRSSGGTWELRHESHGWGVRLTVPAVHGEEAVTLDTEPYHGDGDAVETASRRAVELLRQAGVYGSAAPER